MKKIKSKMSLLSNKSARVMPQLNSQRSLQVLPPLPVVIQPLNFNFIGLPKPAHEQGSAISCNLSVTDNGKDFRNTMQQVSVDETETSEKEYEVMKMYFQEDSN